MFYLCSLGCLYEKPVEELPALYWIQQLSRPNVALQRASNKQLLNHRLVYPSPLVLRKVLHFFFLTADRDQTASRRSKPSSRTILTVEQTDPWKNILNQDMMSRHRGANQLRRWELLGVISLLSLAYLLSVNR